MVDVLNSLVVAGLVITVAVGGWFIDRHHRKIEEKR